MLGKRGLHASCFSVANFARVGRRRDGAAFHGHRRRAADLNYRPHSAAGADARVCGRDRHVVERGRPPHGSFNDFFARAPVVGSRPLAPVEWTSPADGTVLQVGTVRAGALLQEKGTNYSTRALLGGGDALAQQFEGSQFATIYLSPGDNHRVFSPTPARVVTMIFVPG
jgi:phosphatidylserine decarboxylase